MANLRLKKRGNAILWGWKGSFYRLLCSHDFFMILESLLDLSHSQLIPVEVLVPKHRFVVIAMFFCQFFQPLHFRRSHMTFPCTCSSSSSLCFQSSYKICFGFYRDNGCIQNIIVRLHRGKWKVSCVLDLPFKMLLPIVRQ